MNIHQVFEAINAQKKDKRLYDRAPSKTVYAISYVDLWHLLRKYTRRTRTRRHRNTNGRLVEDFEYLRKRKRSYFRT